MKSLLIVDLDNTLYDWVTFYSRALRAMVIELAKLLNVSEEQLLEELQIVHRKYRTSEPPFAVLELPSVTRRFPGVSLVELNARLAPAFRAFNSVRKKFLQLYPTVEESLRNLRMRGVRIVAHTEALFQNAYYRLIKLGLVDLIDRLYTSTTALPPAPNVSIMQPRSDFVSLLGEHERKPDPQVVLDICAKEKVDPVAAVYVGDSLTRDVAMAVNAGVTAVWARYGRSFAQDDWNYLVRITHWTAEDVAYEERLRAHSAAVEPNLIIDRFSGIMGLFDSATRSAYIAR